MNKKLSYKEKRNQLYHLARFYDKKYKNKNKAKKRFYHDLKTKQKQTPSLIFFPFQISSYLIGNQ